MTDKNAQIEAARGLYDEGLVLREYTARLRERDIPYTRDYGFGHRAKTGTTQIRVQVVVHGVVVATFSR